MNFNLKHLIMVLKGNILKNFINMLIRLVSAKRFSLKGFILLILFGSASFFILAHYLINLTPEPVNVHFPQDIVQCPLDQSYGSFMINDHVNESKRYLSGAKVLIVAELPYSGLLRELVSILESLRFKYKVAHLDKPLPQLINKNQGVYSAIVFEKLESYLTLDSWNQVIINNYCIKYKVGVLAFAQTSEVLSNVQVKSLPLYINTNIVISKYMVNAKSPVLRITRPGSIAFDSNASAKRWSVFYSNHSTFEPVSTSTPRDDVIKMGCLFERCEFSPIIRDKGLTDGIQKVFFGFGFRFWLHLPLFVDVLSFISHGKLSMALERNILIDIDDIFVGKPYTRMTKSDVMVYLLALLSLKTVLNNTAYHSYGILIVNFSDKIQKQ